MRHLCDKRRNEITKTRTHEGKNGFSDRDRRAAKLDRNITRGRPEKSSELERSRARDH